MPTLGRIEDAILLSLASAGPATSRAVADALMRRFRHDHLTQKEVEKRLLRLERQGFIRRGQPRRVLDASSSSYTVTQWALPNPAREACAP